MRGGRAIEEFLLDRVPVEPGDSAQPPRDGGPGTAASFQIAAEELDVCAASLKQPQLMLLTPAGELPQVELIRLTRKAAVGGEEPS